MHTTTSFRWGTFVPLTLAVACLALAGVEVASGAWPQPTPVALVWALALLAPVGLLHRQPTVAWLWFAGLIIVTVPTLGLPRSGALFFATVLLLFGLGAFGPGRRQLLVLQPTVAVLAAVISFFDPQKATISARLAEFAPTLVILWAAVGIGLVVAWRSRTARAAHADADLARAESAAAVQRAVAEERARIARDLHDVVAHSVSLMVVQAVGARAMLWREPERARAAFDAIDGAGIRALEELHRMVGVLANAQVGDQTVAEAPGLAGLEDLATAARTTGAVVEVSVTGPVGRLPAGPDLAAYRIVQEALTNAVKHTSGRIWLQVDVTAAAVRIEVDNDLTATELEVAGGGHGLIGMRERVALYGGTLDTGVHGEQWWVLAVLPVSLEVVA